MAADGSSGPAPAWGVALGAVAALWIDLGTLHQGHDADSLVPALVSLQKWTPFYWEQRRFGMLVPLLALPVRDPFANLLLQCALTATAALAAFVATARLFTRSGAALSGLLAGALCLAGVTEKGRFDLLATAQPYGVGLALGACGLLLARGSGSWRWPRTAAAGGLLLLSHWVLPTAFVLLLPLLWLPRLLAGGRGAWTAAGSERRASLLVLVSAIALQLGMRTSRWGRNRGDLLPPAEWAEGWRALAARAGEIAPPELALAALALAGLGASLHLAFTRRDPAAHRALLGAGALALTALGYFLFTGTLEWVVRNNRAAPRYVIPCLQLGLAATALAAGAPLLAARADRLRPVATALAGALLLAAAGARYGAPGLDGVRRDLGDRRGDLVADIEKAGCTHLTGGYWRVWPAVYQVLWSRAHAGRADPFWGVTYRAGPTAELWRPVPGAPLRVCAPNGDTLEEARRYGLPPLRLRESLGTVEVYAPAAAPETSG